MSIMKKSLMGLALAATTMYAAEVGFSGYILGGSGGIVNSEDGTIDYSEYHEIDLTTSLKFSEKVSVDLYTTMNNIDADPEKRWGSVDFDGVTLNYGTDFGTVMVGDLIYNSEKMSYYILKRKSTVLQEFATRGVGLSTEALTAYLGGVGGTDAALYASYAIKTGDLSATPYIQAVLGDETPITAGADLAFTSGAFGLKSSIGVHTAKDMDATTAFTIDPSIDLGNFNIVASFYMAITGDNPAAVDALPTYYTETLEDSTVVDLWEEMFLYVEPGMPINDIVSVGLPLEYHSGAKDAKSAMIGTYPTAYFSVADDASFLLWAGVDQGIGDANKDADAGISFGTEFTATF
ncbi:MAG: hypothetical protein OCC49_02130 [Fibrobacterales bacterium]